jgi:hypothetical protein
MPLPRRRLLQNTLRVETLATETVALSASNALSVLWVLE